MGEGGTVQDQLLRRMWVSHPEWFVRDYCGKPNVAFRADLATPTKMMSNNATLFNGKCFSAAISFAKHYLYGNNTNNCTWEVRGKSFP